MSVNTFNPTLWEDAFYAAINKYSTLIPLVNTEYEGEITQIGDIVTVSRYRSISMGTTGLPSSEYIYPSTEDVTINYDYAFRLKADDLDVTQQDSKKMMTIVENGARTLARRIDEFILSLHSDISPEMTYSEFEVTVSDIPRVLIEAKQDFEERAYLSFKNEDLYCHVHPQAATKILQSKFLHCGDNVSFITGEIGEYLGFNFIISPHVALEEQGESYASKNIICTKNAFACPIKIVCTAQYNSQYEADELTVHCFFGITESKPQEIYLLDIECAETDNIEF